MKALPSLESNVIKGVLVQYAWLCICTFRFSLMGNYLFSGSDDGNLFVIDGRPSTMFQPLGFVREFSQISSTAILHKTY